MGKDPKVQGLEQVMSPVALYDAGGWTSSMQPACQP